MTSKEYMSKIQNAIAGRIKSGEVRMRPRWHFILKAVLFAAGFIIAALALLFVVSLVFFALRQTGVLFVPGFGWRGIGVFLFSLPWVLVLVSAVFVICLELLAKHYAFGYRRPLLYSVLAIVLFIIGGGAVMAYFDVHQGFSRFAREHRVPFAEPLYKSFDEQRFNNIHAGVISARTEEGFVLTNRSGERLEIVVDGETRFPFGTDVQDGDVVVIMGERASNTVRAFGVRRMDDAPPRSPGMHGGRRPSWFRMIAPDTDDATRTVPMMP